ncbi:hypothetical protein CFOL_v3_25450 [Cephalotus follicularis]|uniref:SAP domain-containing protein n=1 Tax=Cephalotus follicularis TaxID=3775 RepID=A0A1Q3CP43_CEPFO|nr:hypothetical protein CFOL_v3_25450 [Cephalotus follicularis]
MDFHRLTRKELQALCKKNRIPANMTNAAMADALISLNQVEGLHEFLNKSETNTSQSPEKLVPGSLQIPCTATRTATRRKVKTSEEKITVCETPMMLSGRERTRAASCLIKEDSQKDGCSMQRVYSTRRSVRLLEKNMVEKGSTEPVMMNALDEVEKKKDDISGLDMQTISDDVREKADDAHIYSGHCLNVSLENKGEYVLGMKMSDKDEAKAEVAVSLLDVKDVAYDEKAIQMRNAIIDGQGSDFSVEVIKKENNFNKDMEPMTEDLSANEDAGSAFAVEVINKLNNLNKDMEPMTEDLSANEDSGSAFAVEVINKENNLNKDMEPMTEDHSANEDAGSAFSVEVINKENNLNKDMESMTEDLSANEDTGSAFAVEVINKENINNSRRKVDPKEARNKEITIDADILDSVSLRKLTKMLKNCLQITNNAKENKKVHKEPVWKRPALQTMPQNIMPAKDEMGN